MSDFRVPSSPLFPDWALSTPNSSESESFSSMPPEWASDDTMLGYFGPLDSNSKNPVVLRQRESRLAFWRELILSSFRSHPSVSNMDPILSAPILKVLLRRKNLVPMGIQQILDDLVERKILIPVNQFLRPEPSSWWSKLAGLVSSPVKEETPQYVLLPILEERVQQLAADLPVGEAVMPLEQFFSMAKGVHFDLLSPLLPNIMQFEVREQKAVKIATKQENAKISDSDRALFHITTSVKKLEQKEAKYVEDIKLLRREVVDALKSGTRSRAAMLLRRSKLYESQLDKTMISRDQLLRIAASIEEAQTSADVFQALKLGASALKTENERIGSIDTVDTLMDTISDLTEQQESISEAIGSSHSLQQVDEALLEAELLELIKEDVLPSSSATNIANSDTLLDKLVVEMQKVNVTELPTVKAPPAPTEQEKREFAI